MVSPEKLAQLVQNGIGSVENRIEKRTHDLLKEFRAGKHDVLAVGISCFNEDQRGIVKKLFKFFPKVEAVFKHVSEDGNFEKIGTNLYVKINSRQTIVFMFIKKSDHFRTEVNTNCRLNLKALSTCFTEILSHMSKSQTICFPELGKRNDKNQVNIDNTLEQALENFKDIGAYKYVEKS